MLHPSAPSNCDGTTSCSSGTRATAGIGLRTRGPSCRTGARICSDTGPSESECICNRATRRLAPPSPTARHLPVPAAAPSADQIHESAQVSYADGPRSRDGFGAEPESGDVARHRDSAVRTSSRFGVSSSRVTRRARRFDARSSGVSFLGVRRSALAWSPVDFACDCGGVSPRARRSVDGAGLGARIMLKRSVRSGTLTSDPSTRPLSLAN